jgi:hypothetical protein
MLMLPLMPNNADLNKCVGGGEGLGAWQLLRATTACSDEPARYNARRQI